MRKNWMFTASAVALTWASAAAADTTIATAITTPVATSTANNGAADNVVVSAAGSIKPTTSVAAVTLNSNNTVSNAGVIDFADVNNATGILVKGGFAGGVTNTGTITVRDTTVAKDNDNDGDLDGPFVVGTGRYGIRVTGPGLFTGAINNAATITVLGEDSAGLSVETDLAGSVANGGSITVTGSRTYGVRTAGAVSGNVSSLGSITMVGEGSKALSVEGAVGGGVIVQGALVTTGYRTASRPSDATVISKLDADDLLQAGSAVSITNNVAKGLLLDAPPTERDAANTDEDGDGIADASEGTASVITYGGAPAIQIGSLDREVRLGAVGAGDYGYGVVIRGAVQGRGVYDGVSATGLRIGVANGTRTVIDNGVRVAGQVGSLAYVADAYGILAEGGAEIPTIANLGGISATVVSEGVNTATGIAIRSGATVQSLTNVGIISASLSGEKGDAIAIRDQSGTLTDIRNGGLISAIITPTDDANDKDDADNFAGNEVVTGRAVAIDVSANTTGVRLLQGKDTGATPEILGAIKFGSGSDRIDLIAGSITGDIAFGAGANVLVVNGGSTVTGKVNAVGGNIDLYVIDGGLTFLNSESVAVSGLLLGAKSQLIFTADPTTGTATQLNVAGNASIASGAKIGLRLASLQNGTQTYTVIRANQLTAGAIDSTLLGSIPYLYGSSLTTNQAAGTVQISVTRKTAADLQLAPTISGAYEAFLVAAAKDDNLETAALSVTDRASFISLYEQLLPNRSGGIFQWSAAASDAFARASTDRPFANGGLFIQESAFGVVRDREGEQAGYKAWGIGLTAGYETPDTGIGAFGVTVSGASGEVTDKGAAQQDKMDLKQVESGAYWRLRSGPFTANAAATGAYLDVDSDRGISISLGDDGYLQRTAKADWQGWSINARAGADYKLMMGRTLFLRPSASVAYHRLSEGSYQESGGGSGVDLSVDKRKSSQLAAFAGVGIGAFFGQDNIGWGPELTLGYRQVVKETLGDTTARYLSGGNAFTVMSEEIGDAGPVARFAIKGDLQNGGFAFQLGADRRSGLQNYDFRLTAHLVF